MKNSSRFFAALILVCLLAGCAPATPTPTPPPPTVTPVLTPPTFETLIPIARAFVNEMAAGNFSAAYSRFDQSMKNVMPLAKLEDNWLRLLNMTGNFQLVTGTRTRILQGKPVVSVICDFDNGSLDVVLAFNNQSLIVGMTFTDMAISVPAPHTS